MRKETTVKIRLRTDLKEFMFTHVVAFDFVHHGITWVMVAVSDGHCYYFNEDDVIYIKITEDLMA